MYSIYFDGGFIEKNNKDDRDTYNMCYCSEEDLESYHNAQELFNKAYECKRYNINEFKDKICILCEKQVTYCDKCDNEIELNEECYIKSTNPPINLQQTEEILLFYCSRCANEIIE